MFLLGREMDFVGARYYRLNRILLSGLGLWPSETSCARIRVIFFYVLFLSFLYVQLCALVTSARNLELILKILAHIMPVLVYTVQYNAHHVCAKKVRLMMEEIRDGWNALDDKREVGIIERYARYANICTIVLTLCTFIFLLVFVFIEVLPMLLDVVAPLNESRPRKMHVKAEYFVDPAKYFPFMLLHEIAACCGGATTVLATGTTLLAYVYYVCGMLRIVSLRIERAFDASVLQRSTARAERAICGRISRAVDLHRKSLRFMDFLLTTFAMPFGILIVIGVASITLNLFRLLQPATIKNTTELITSIVLVIGHVAYMFLANYVAQTVTDHSADIFNTTCNVMWYVAPLSSQKILLFLMHRTIKLFKLVLCHDMFVASLEGFATLSTTSLSYLTVIYSIQ